MVSSSKILTVSYGTFSCTAEGFEDPLAVVKETTHFFRGVVGEDRFFGAEPPQFDADLATEMMRDRLTPEMGRGTLSLGQAMATGAASSGALAAALGAGPSRAAPAPAKPALPDDDTIEATAVLTERPAEAPLAEERETLPALADDGEADGPDFDMSDILEPEVPPRAVPPSDVAAKLDRIRAVVAGNAAAETEEDAEVDLGPELSAEDQTAADAGDDVDDDALAALLSEYGASDDAEAPLDLEDALDDAAGAADAAPEDDNLFADTISGLIAAEASVEPAVDPALEMPDIATAFAYDDSEEDDDTPGPALTGGGDAFAAWDDDAEDDIPAPAAAATDLAEDVSDLLDDDDDDDDEDDVDDAPVLATPAPPPPPPAAAPKPAIRARVVKVKRTVFEEAVKSGQLEEVEDPLDPVPGESSLSPEEEDELARELAAVTAEMSDGWGDDEEEDDFLDAPVAAEPRGDTAWDDLDDDDEDDDDADDWQAAPAPLRLDNPVNRPASRPWDDDIEALDARAAAASQGRASAAPHDDDEDDDEDDSIEAMVRESARKAVKMASPARALLTEGPVEDNDTSRILDETNKELDEPEGSRRRTAIAHLRAAVAATRADRLLGRKADVEQEAQPYREDLADVVRPRRPQPRGAVPAEPATRPAPLKLVAEQRVPEPRPAPTPEREVTPVRPRRIRREAAARAREDVEANAMDSGFADYAASVGAVDLPELLEAAAAYMSFVEGREQFSRPQLMTTVRQAEQNESSREDRLRSFGQLLREGKIEKTSGGRFTASDRISFKPDRAAG